MAFASSLDQIGPFAGSVADAALLFDAIGGHDPLDSTSLNRPTPRALSVLDDGVEGMRVGVLTELLDGAAPDVAARVGEAAEALAAAGARVEEVSVPEVTLGLSAYYLIAPGEASSNLARYDGVRYGLRVEAADTTAMNTATRTEGFGDEVKRRIMLGTYVLSAGYMDAYYNQALRVRTRIIEGFAAAYGRCRRPARTHHPDHGLRPGRQGRRPAGHVPLRRLHHPVQPGRSPGRQRPLRTGRRRPSGGGPAARTGPGRGRPAAGGGGRGGGRARAAHPTGAGGGAGMRTGWELVIGLEVHCELKTATKLFCGCPNAFGDEPNTNVCPTCLGLPGSLPVLNQRAVELAMAIGSALHCDILPSTFHRKNYFYPDQAKDYQISQYDEPLNADGHLDLPDGTRVGIERAHMEEDTGKTTHAGASGRIHGADYSLVDYNRSGVPLVEIVSAPDMRSADQARAYVTELRAVLVASGASDGKMEEGSMRVDANVSVRRDAGAPFGTRCEIKNLNSVRSLGRAIDYEAERQIALLESGGEVVQQTRHWDEVDGRTQALRSKEDAFDYRYFLEPDLVPLVPDGEWIRAVADTLGLMPAARRSRLVDLLDGAGGRHRRPGATRWPRWSTWGSTTWWWRPWPRGWGRHWPWPARPTRPPPTPRPPAGSTPKSYVELLTLEAQGSLSATQAKAVLAELFARGGATRRPSPATRGSRPCPRTPCGHRGRRRGRGTPTSGPATAAATTSWPASSRAWS